MSLALFQAGRVISTMTEPVCAIFTGDYNMSKEESAEAYGVMSALFMNKQSKPVWAAPFDYMSKTPLKEVLGFITLCQNSCEKCIGRVEDQVKRQMGFYLAVSAMPVGGNMQ